MSLEVTEHLGDLGSPREEGSECIVWHLFERKFVTLSIERVDDFFEAHEITDEGQIFAITRLVRVRECARNDVAKFGNVAHVNATHIRIKRKSPADGSVCLLLRSNNAREILVEERRDDECVMSKPGFFHDPIDLGFAGKVRNVELAAADRFDIG